MAYGVARAASLRVLRVDEADAEACRCRGQAGDVEWHHTANLPVRQPGKAAAS